MKIKILSLCAVGLLGLYIAILFFEPKQNNQKFSIVCTTNLIADIVLQLVPSNVKVITLMGPGIDPHQYKPIEQDIFSINQANLIFYHGLHLEACLADLFVQLNKIKPCFAVTQTIPTTDLLYPDTHLQYPDPHVWFNPQLWIMVVEYIASILKTQLPHDQDLIMFNAQSYIKNIQTMIQNTQTLINQTSIKKRYFITNHDAFSYFAQAYTCTVISLQGINTANQADLSDIQRVLQEIRQHNISTIFTETNTSKRFIQTLIQAAARENVCIHEGPILFADSLGAKNTAQSSYVKMMEYNCRMIAESWL